jgi:hypothetical protein
MESASPQAGIHAYYHAFESALLMGISYAHEERKLFL